MRVWSFAAGTVLLLFAAAGQNRPQPVLIEDHGFVPAGWMGDAGKQAKAAEKPVLEFTPLDTSNPHSPPYSQRWSYRPKRGGQGWAAVAWQYPENNFGEKAGKDWRGRNFTEVTVWARGVKDSAGNLPKVQFKAGGGTDVTKRFQASFEVANPFVTLTETWSQYRLDIKGKDLSQVVAAFVLVVRAQDAGLNGFTLYLDDIEYR